MGREATSIRQSSRNATTSHDRSRNRGGRGRESVRQTHKIYTKYKGETTGMGGTFSSAILRLEKGVNSKKLLGH